MSNTEKSTGFKTLTSLMLLGSIFRDKCEKSGIDIDTLANIGSGNFFKPKTDSTFPFGTKFYNSKNEFATITTDGGRNLKLSFFDSQGKVEKHKTVLMLLKSKTENERVISDWIKKLNLRGYSEEKGDSNNGN